MVGAFIVLRNLVSKQSEFSHPLMGVARRLVGASLGKRY
jgi:hypothetical protein